MTTSTTSGAFSHWHLGYVSCWICATLLLATFFPSFLPRCLSCVWVVNNGSMSVRHTSRRPLWLWIVFSSSHNNVIYGFEGEWFSCFYFKSREWNWDDAGTLDKFMLTFGKNFRVEEGDNALVVMKQHLLLRSLSESVHGILPVILARGTFHLLLALVCWTPWTLRFFFQWQMSRWIFLTCNHIHAKIIYSWLARPV